MTHANDHFGQHNGTEHFYSCRPFPFTYTDGVRDLVQNCKAYWLLELIVCYQVYERVSSHSFQVWELKRAQGDSFDLLATDGNDHEIASQHVPFSDFPFDVAIIWMVDGTLLLPCEY